VGLGTSKPKLMSPVLNGTCIVNCPGAPLPPVKLYVPVVNVSLQEFCELLPCVRIRLPATALTPSKVKVPSIATSPALPSSAKPLPSKMYVPLSEAAEKVPPPPSSSPHFVTLWCFAKASAGDPTASARAIPASHISS